MGIDRGRSSSAIDGEGLSLWERFVRIRETKRPERRCPIVRNHVCPDEVSELSRLPVESYLDDPVPVPASVPQEAENQDFNYAFMSTRRDSQPDPDAPWIQGETPDSNGQFSYLAEQLGDGEGVTSDPDPSTYNEPNETDRSDTDD